MAEQMNHKAQAEALLVMASDVRREVADVTLAAAQVHATLALVEQQRIANLIALGKYTNADGSRLAQHAVAHPIDGYSVAINDDIREGLDL